MSGSSKFVRMYGVGAAALSLMVGGVCSAKQPPGDGFDGPPPGMGPGGFGGPGGGGPGGPERKLVDEFDKDGNGRLNATERAAAREKIKKEKTVRGGGGRVRGPGGPGGGFSGGPGGEDEPVKAGPAVATGDVKSLSGDLYDPTVFRTVFLTFESSDWESELEDFYNTDVEVPATMTIDGKTYPSVGVHFRGSSSYFMVAAGHKRSLNVSVDFTDKKQEVTTDGGGKSKYKTLNLLNSHEDPSFMSTVLYSSIANQYIPAPRSNFVRVVINGESWGVYVNVEQFNKEFVKRNFKSKGKDTSAKLAGSPDEPKESGARWKVKGSPGARSGLEYTGEDVAPYKSRYQIKSKDDDKDWADLINLCKVLNTTPPEKLEKALEPILDVDAALWFLALDVVLANGDGYWVRSSDYSIYKDPFGKFHIVPHDMNECFQSNLMIPGGGGGRGGPGRRPGGPGSGGPGEEGTGARPEGGENNFPTSQRPPEQPGQDGKQPPQGDRPASPQRGPDGMRGPGGGGQSGTELDPLIGLNDAAKPLRSKLLAVPALRERYMQHVRTIAEKSLDWSNLGKVVAVERGVIEKALESDTRKLTSLESFHAATADVAPAVPKDAANRRGEPMSLRGFADKRRAYLLSYKPKDAAPAQQAKEQEQR